ncbi:hypothetical protein HYV74_03050 [Candidatus Uhrbacteria bacterium]|nr:hypothetical protein [Candidatus Uhrbacteria bacterium]
MTKTRRRLARDPMAHPLLASRIDMDEGALQQLRKHRTFDYTNIRLFESLIRERQAHPEGALRLMQGAFPFIPPEENAERAIGGAIGEAHTMLAQQIEQWIPEEHAKTIRRNTVIHEPPGSLNELLAIMMPKSDREEQRRLSFEARRLHHLAMLILRIRYGGYLGASTPSFYKRSLDAYSYVQDLFQKQLITQLPNERTIFANFTNVEGKNPEGRCLDVSFTPKAGWQSITLPDVGQFQDTCKRAIDCLIQYRVKTPFSIILHMLRDNISFPEWVEDIRGIRIACWSHDDRITCYETLAKTFPRFGFWTAGWNDRYTKTSQRALNRFSGSYFRAMKLYGEFDDQSGPWEVQIMHIRDYLNLWYSRGEENWFRYRLRQLLRLFFPVYFPTQYYQVPWSSDRIRGDCRRLILTKKRGTIVS